MTRSKRKGKGRDPKWTNRDELEMSNERFEKYYKAQQILPADEWDSFMQALRQPLPSTFRIAGNRQMKDVLNNAIKNTFVPQLETGSFNGEPLPVPRPIPWYPQGLAWHLSVPRKELRRSPEYKRFHSFLVYETEIGNISRQEAVSMLPPLFLDVRPDHSVIDLCAAPGSKTSQLLEAMDPPSGILVANDADHKRAQLLVHTSARLPSPALMVTNLDASVFPYLKSRGEYLRFDRILADVPCSGDGTLRKNVGIWRNWSPMEGNGLHSLQLRILQRAMRMLKNGTEPSQDKPRIVYSTCSLNPVENEAVIAAALNSVPGFELVDVSGTLPALIRRPGLSAWRPAVDRDVDVTHASYEDYCTALKKLANTFTVGMPEDGEGHGEIDEDKSIPKGKRSAKGKEREGMVRNRMLATHWPPSNADQLRLERCMRIYPHLQDSGGFFVAVLQRSSDTTLCAARPKMEGKRPVPVKDTAGANETVEVEEGPVAKKPKLFDENDNAVDSDSPEFPSHQEDAGEPNAESTGVFKENPFTFVSADEPSLVSCIKKLNLSPTFPRSNLYVRNPDGAPLRSLYLVNDAVKAIMERADYTKIRLVSAGVKLFGRSELGHAKGASSIESSTKDSKTEFRVLSEGLLALLPYIDYEALVNGDALALRTLLETYYPLCSSFKDPFRSNIEARALGSHIIRFVPGEYGSVSLSHDLFLPLWKSDVSVSLMIDKKAKSALSLRLFGEDITVAGRQALKQQQEKFLRTGSSLLVAKDDEVDDVAEDTADNVAVDLD